MAAPPQFHYTFALVRGLPASFEDSLKLVPVPIDVARAAHQHEAYNALLRELLPSVIEVGMAECCAWSGVEGGGAVRAVRGHPRGHACNAAGGMRVQHTKQGGADAGMAWHDRAHAWLRECHPKRTTGVSPPLPTALLPVHA